MYLGTHAVSIWAEARGLSLSTSWQSLSLDLELTKRLGCPSSNMLVSACPQPEDPSIPVSHIHAMAPDFCVDAGWGSELRSSYLPAVYQLIYLPSPYVNFLGGCFTKKINRQQNLIVPQKKKKCLLMRKPWSWETEIWDPETDNILAYPSPSLWTNGPMRDI